MVRPRCKEAAARRPPRASSKLRARGVGNCRSAHPFHEETRASGESPKDADPLARAGRRSVDDVQDGESMLRADGRRRKLIS